MAGRSVLELILRITKQGNNKAIKKDLKEVAKMMAGVAAAAYAAKKAFDFAKEGAALKRLEKAGTTLAASFGQDMDAIVSAIQRASGGTISESDAMLAANRALQLGVASTPQEFEKLTKSAIALGRAMGRDARQSMDDIVTGIGRMSPLILDNIGILTRGGAVFDDYAASVGKAADELTDAEKKQALLNVTVQSASKFMDKNGNLTSDAASSYEVLAAYIKDATEEGKKMLSDFLAPVVDFLAEDISSTAEARDVLELYGASVKQNGVVLDAMGKFLAENIQALVEQHQALMDAANAAGVADQLLGHYVQTTATVPELVSTDVKVTGAEDAEQTFITLAELAHAYASAAAAGHEEFRAAAKLAGKLGRTGPFGPGFQHGGTMTVPPGFPNDSFPLRVSSGETVNVSNNDNRQFNINMPGGGPDIVDALARRIRRL